MKTTWPAKQLDIEAAVLAIKDYCKRNSLNENEIDRYQKSWDSVLAVKYKDIHADGLCDDIETLPDILLYYDMGGVVHETEHTKTIKMK